MSDTLSIAVIEGGVPVIYNFYGGVSKAAARKNLELSDDDGVVFLTVTANDFTATAGGFYGKGLIEGSHVHLFNPDAFNLDAKPTVSGSWSDGSAGVSLAVGLATLGLIVNTTTP